MIDVVLYIIAAITLLIGSYTDFKKREVPDWASYSLIISALGIRLLYSLFTRNASFIIDGIAGFILLFAIANLLYYLRQWGGGDAKISMGIGAVLGLSIFDKISYFNLIWFFFLLIFIGAVYGLCFSFYLASRNWNRFKRFLVVDIKDFKYLGIFFSLFLIVSLGTYLIQQSPLSFLLFGVSIILLIGIFSFVFVKSVEESCLIQRLKAKQLTEGDWVLETIKIKGKTIVSENNLGITKQQINKLKSYNKLITVKAGIPFIPVFFLSFIAFILTQNWLYSALY